MNKKSFLQIMVLWLIAFSSMGGGTLTAGQKKAVDLVVFSFDRPMQLFAFLESCDKHVTGLNEMHLIYRSSNESYEQGYQTVFRHFPQLHTHQQSANPEKDFKPLVLKTAFSKKSSAPYIMFGVDDIVVKSDIDLCVCVNALEESKAWGFFLRMGKNISYCTMRQLITPVPQGKKIANHIFLWKFRNGKGDWNYPNSVDMTIYRKKDISDLLHRLEYTTPNKLECHWFHRHHHTSSGICFRESKIVNIPLNQVNPSRNFSLHAYQPAELLTKFQQGLKIDIKQYETIRHNTPHVDQLPTFIPMK